MSTNATPAMKELSTIAAENNPNGIAFGETATDEEVTWAEFDRRSRRAANGFQDHVAQGDRIAFLCEASIDHVTLWNGALKAGCVVSNLHTRASPKTVAHCIDELRPRVLVLDEKFSQWFQEDIADKISTQLDKVITIGDPNAEYEESASEFVSDRSKEAPDVHVTEDDIAAVIWTSGTTSMPKGWCFTNEALVNRGMKILSSGSSSHETRSLQGLTPSFAAWYSLTLPALLVNSSTYFVRDWDPEKYLRIIEEKEITSVTLVPTMWQEMLQLDDFDEYDISSLESIGASGERLNVATLRELQENICDRVTSAYAATEAVVSAISHDELKEDLVESVGKPTPGTRVRVIEEGGSPDDTKPPGETGEIIVNGTDNPVWAWGETEKTEAAFEDGWWYSGDLGYKDEDGYLFLEGRKDFMIKSKGIKVNPSPIEERLNDHPDVEEAAVVGVEDEEFGQKVTAVVTASDGDVTPEELDQWCLDADSIARFERPREYEIGAEPLPKTVTGKLDRKATKERI